VFVCCKLFLCYYIEEMLAVYSIVRNICLDILSFGEGNLVFTTTKVYAKLMCQTSATPTTKNIR